MKDKLLVIAGPTAVGKTDLSIKLAEKYNGEIISCDSMQIYKHMNIGTDKASIESRKKIKHHLIDFINIDEEYTVSNYQEDAERLIKDINSRGKLPIMVGGTGLYINSIVYDLNFIDIPANKEIRVKYENLIENKGRDYVYNKLKTIDPDICKKIHRNDIKRVIRALEVYEETGITMSEHNKNFRKEVDKYNLKMICLNRDRKELYDRINKRVDEMIEEGLIKEVKAILEMGYSENLTSLQAIGYKEIIDYIKGRISLDEAIRLIKKGSRNYAKRQLTWFRRDKRYNWIRVDDYKGVNSLVENIEKSIINNFV